MKKKNGFIRNVSPCNSHCLWSLLAFCPELPESNTPSSTQNPSDVAVALHPPLPRPQQPLSPSRSIPTSATPGTHHPPRQLEKWCFRKKKKMKKREKENVEAKKMIWCNGLLAWALAGLSPWGGSQPRRAEKKPTATITRPRLSSSTENRMKVKSRN